MSLTSVQIVTRFQKPRDTAIAKAAELGLPVPIAKTPITVTVRGADLYKMQGEGDKAVSVFDADKAQNVLQTVLQEANARGAVSYGNLLRNITEWMASVQAAAVADFFKEQDPSVPASLEGFDAGAFDLVELLTTIDESGPTVEITEEMVKTFASAYVVYFVESGSYDGLSDEETSQLRARRQAMALGHLAAAASNFRAHLKDVEKNKVGLQKMHDLLQAFAKATQIEDAAIVARSYAARLHRALNPRKRVVADVGELQFD